VPPVQTNTDRSGGQAGAEQGFKRISGGAEVISFAQFKEFIDTKGRGDRLKGNPEMQRRVFDRLDSNNDGVLSYEEYKQLQNRRR